MAFMSNEDTISLDSQGQGAIMSSIDPKINVEVNKTNDTTEMSSQAQASSYDPRKSLPDVLSTELQSLNLLADTENNRLSFLLLDNRDNLCAESAENFALKLGCDLSVNAKVLILTSLLICRVSLIQFVFPGRFHRWQCWRWQVLRHEQTLL